MFLFVAPAAADDPLYLQTPHDEITLDENNDNAVLKVKLLELPHRRLPSPEQRQGELEIELLIRPGDRFKVEWLAIAQVVLFEDRLLAEAADQVRTGNFDEAYRYYQLLEERFPQARGLKEAVESFLWAQITAAYRAGRLNETLALLVKLHQRNPQRAGLANAYERVSLTQAERELAAGNYRAARGLVRNLVQRFPAAQPAAASVETQLQQQAAKLLGEAQAHLAAGRGRQAWQTSRQMLDVWPTLAGGQELARRVHLEYPVVVVAVTSPPSADAGLQTASNHDFAATRVSRLLARPLVERNGSSQDQGHRFHSAFGQLERGEGGRRLTLQLHGNLAWGSPPQTLTAAHVAPSLLARTDPSQPQFDAALAEQLIGFAALSAQRVEMEFRSPQVAAEAWLRVPLLLDAANDGGLQILGPYRVDESTTEQTRFVRQAGDPMAQTGQPAEIVERLYREDAAALRALRRGEASALDRVSPWELPRLAAEPDLVVQAYAVPRVHLLVTNPHRAIATSRTLRRAVLYGIDRASILREGLLAGREVPDCQVISGPLPLAGGGYDAEVEPARYDPATAAVLARWGGEEPPALVLVHPAGPVPRVACQSIANQLGLAGMKIELREHSLAEPLADDWDLQYVEVALAEPAVDVWRLLGPGGLAGSVSPAMLRALRELQLAADAEQAAARLQAIHRLAAAELPVIPLWQLVDHAVYHRSLQGVGDNLTSLYENVEHWQTELRVPSE